MIALRKLECKIEDAAARSIDIDRCNICMRLYGPDKNRMRFIRQMNVVEKCRLAAEHLTILQPEDRMADKRSDAVGKLINNIHTQVLRDPRKTDNSRQIIVMFSPPTCPGDIR